MNTLTKKINGGFIGLEDRIHHWNIALDLMESE
jgi:predicted chitinase